jgi:hypothetical protein
MGCTRAQLDNSKCVTNDGTLPAKQDKQYMGVIQKSIDNKGTEPKDRTSERLLYQLQRPYLSPDRHDPGCISCASTFVLIYTFYPLLVTSRFRHLWRSPDLSDGLSHLLSPPTRRHDLQIQLEAFYSYPTSSASGSFCQASILVALRR